jgi:small conductance mechanosensitive channel
MLSASATSLLLPFQVRVAADAFQNGLPVAAQKGLQVVAVLLVAIIARRLVQVASRRIIRAVDDGDPNTFTMAERRGHTIAQLLNSVGSVAILIVSGLTILSFFVPIAPFLASIGVAGLAISFGAQSLVKDVISGFFILIENQFDIGDVIEIDRVSGVVERMTLRVVMIRDGDGVLHIIPNGSIPRVSNKTRGWAKSVVDVPVSYKEDLDVVIRALREVATEFWKEERWSAELTEEPAVLGVETLGDGSVSLRVVATTRPGRQWDVGRELRRRIKNRFDKEGFSMPVRALTGDPALFQALGGRPVQQPPAGA